MVETSGQRHSTAPLVTARTVSLMGLAVSVDRQYREPEKTQNMRRWIAETGDDAHRAARVSENFCSCVHTYTFTCSF